MNPIIEDVARQHKLRGPDLGDCTQEVWHGLIVGLAAFRHDPGRCGIRTWLRVVARNKTVDFIRRSRRRVLLPLDDASDAGPAAPEEDRDGPSDPGKIADEVRHALREAAGTIPEQSLRIFVMRCMEGRSAAETAAALGLRPQEVWVRYHRARKHVVRLIMDRRCASQTT